MPRSPTFRSCFSTAKPRGVRKDDVAQEYIGRQNGREGVMFLGKAQEKTPVCRTERRRLRLHGIIDRIPHTHRYRLTQRGIQIAAFWTRTYNRLRRPGLAQRVAPGADHAPLRRKLLELVAAIDAASDDLNIAA